MAKWNAALGIALLPLGLGACVSGATKIVAPAAAVRPHVQSVTVVAGAHDVGVDLGEVRQFEDSLRTRLYAPGAFTQGPDMTIQYRFLSYQGGRQVRGYVLGVEAAQGKTDGMEIEVRYLAPNGAELARIEVDGATRLGPFKQAVEKAATQAADYAVVQFK